MTNYNTAAESARALANQFRALLTVGDALADFASFDNQRIELEEAKKTAEANLESVRADLTRDSKRLEEVQAEVTESIIETEVILQNANSKAKKLIADASHEAHEILAVASKTEQEVKAQVDKLKVEYSAFKSKVETAKEQYTSEIEKLKEELKAVKDRFKF